MNRFRLGLLGMVVVLGLAGCAKGQGATQQPQATEGSSTVEGSAGNDGATANDVVTGAFFSRGVYEAYEDGELAQYFYFYDAESGRVENAYEGTGVGFACEQKADEVVFHMGSVDDVSVMKMSRDEEGNITGTYADGSATYTFRPVENADPETFDPTAGTGEDAVGEVDIADCDTFTDIVNKLESGQGYANEKLDGTDVLLVSPDTFNVENNPGAISADVYIYDKNGVPRYLGYVSSDGTAYPVSILDQKLYTGGHHRVTKSTVMDEKLITLEESREIYGEDGTPTYHFYSDDGEGVDEAKDSTTFDRLVDEYMQTKPVVFYVIQ